MILSIGSTSRPAQTQMERDDERYYVFAVSH